MESGSVIPVASPRDLELDFPSSHCIHRESRTSTTLACDSASKIVIASQMSIAQREGIYFQWSEKEKEENVCQNYWRRVRNNVFPSQHRTWSIKQDPWSPVFYFLTTRRSWWWHNCIAPIELAQDALTKVQSNQHLGVNFSHDLRWNNHVDYILTKATRLLSVLRRLRSSLDQESLSHMYLRQDPPLEAILVIFGRRALIFFLFESSWKKMKNDATFVRMRSGDHLGDAKMSKKGTSLRRI